MISNKSTSLAKDCGFLFSELLSFSENREHSTTANIYSFETSCADYIILLVNMIWYNYFDYPRSNIEGRHLIYPLYSNLSIFL